MEEPRKRDAIPRHLRSLGYAAAVEGVMDNLAGFRDVRTELEVWDGRFLMTSRDEFQDRGKYAFNGETLVLSSKGFPGNVTHRVDIDADSLRLMQIDNRNPTVGGVPDAAFQHVLLGAATFRWHRSRIS